MIRRLLSILTWRQVSEPVKQLVPASDGLNLPILYDDRDSKCVRITESIMSGLRSPAIKPLRVAQKLKDETHVRRKILIAHGSRMPKKFIISYLNDIEWWQRQLLKGDVWYLVVCFGHHLVQEKLRVLKDVSFIGYSDTVGYFNNKHINPYMKTYMREVEEILGQSNLEPRQMHRQICQAKSQMASSMENRMKSIQPASVEYKAIEQYLAEYEENGFHVPELLHVLDL